MPEKRVQIEFPEDRRWRLKEALAAEHTDISKWFRKLADEKIKEYEDRTKPSLVNDKP